MSTRIVFVKIRLLRLLLCSNTLTNWAIYQFVYVKSFCTVCSRTIGETETEDAFKDLFPL